MKQAFFFFLNLFKKKFFFFFFFFNYYINYFTDSTSLFIFTLINLYNKYSIYWVFNQIKRSPFIINCNEQYNVIYETIQFGLIDNILLI